jgi:hypothetical protein
MPSAAIGWIALLLLPAVALMGWLLRRRRAGTRKLRMRPHLMIGYAVLLLAGVHMWLSVGGMGSANGTGIWLATFAILALCVQAFIGTNLQSPGAYRPTLRRWHVIIFIAALGLAVGHVALNAPMFATASALDPR